MIKFTRKEIELAGKLEENGLKWIPSIGDCFHECVLLSRTHCVSLVKRNGEDMVRSAECGLFFGMEETLWLPLEHQCFKIFIDNEMAVTLFSEAESAVLSVVKIDGEEREFLGQSVGYTPRQVLYKALLDYVIIPKADKDINPKGYFKNNEDKWVDTKALKTDLEEIMRRYL